MPAIQAEFNLCCSNMQDTMFFMHHSTSKIIIEVVSYRKMGNGNIANVIEINFWVFFFFFLEVSPVLLLVHLPTKISHSYSKNLSVLFPPHRGDFLNAWCSDYFVDSQTANILTMMQVISVFKVFFLCARRLVEVFHL